MKVKPFFSARSFMASSVLAALAFELIASIFTPLAAYSLAKAVKASSRFRISGQVLQLNTTTTALASFRSARLYSLPSVPLRPAKAGALSPTDTLPAALAAGAAFSAARARLHTTNANATDITVAKRSIRQLLEWEPGPKIHARAGTRRERNTSLRRRHN